MSELKLFFLGPPRMEKAQALCSTQTRKATALIARLALSPDPLSRDLLAAFLWPESDDRRARSALRRTLSDLKHTVGEEALFITRSTLGANREALWCDVLAFQEAIGSARDHNHARGLCDGCMPQAETAVSLYRDDFLSGFHLRDSHPFDDWQLQQTEHLRREYTATLEALAEAKGDAGEFDEAIMYTQKWLASDPLREEAHRLLMKLYTWTGQRSAALQQYRACMRILEEELGVAPLAETTALYVAVLEERLDPPPLAPASALQEGEPAEKAAGIPADLPFVGREAELAQMRAVYDQVGPDGRLLVLSGEAGIGKTRLAETFLADARGAAVLRARCYPGETQLTFAPFVQAVRNGLRRSNARGKLATLPPAAVAEAARLLPELYDLCDNLPQPPPLDWPGAQERFFEALGQILTALLSGDQPGILWLDDVELADSASLDLLVYLAHRWSNRPNLLLVCQRSGDIGPGSQLAQLVAAARREGSGVRIALQRLGPEMISQIVAGCLAQLDTDSSDQISTRLYSETEGLPFLVTAYLQSTVGDTTPPEDVVSPGETGAVKATWAMPATVRDLFETRLATIDETERQVLQTAAVIGRACDFHLLQTVSGRSDEETITAVEDALAHLLLVEIPPKHDYDFSHHKLRDLVIEGMSLARRRLLHRRVARALAIQHALSEEIPSEYSARIARHYQQAGLDLKAAAYFFQAGFYARNLFAQREALEHFQTALALGHPDPSALHEIVGALHVRLGHYAAALNSFEHAIVHCDQAAVWRLEHQMAQVYYRRGEWGAAEYHFQQAEATAKGATGADDLARLYLDWSIATYRAGDVDKARELLDKASPLSDSAAALAYLNNMRGILERRVGDLDAALAYFTDSHALAQENGLTGMEITAANNLALTRAEAGQREQAQPLFEAALELCRRYGDRHWEGALHNNLADLFHEMCQEEQAMIHLKDSITILAEIGREAGEWQPEIWKLSEW